VERKAKAIAEGKEITGEEDFNYFMAIHYPSTKLEILDYNRIIKSIEPFTNEEFLAKISDSYVVEKVASIQEAKPKTKYSSSLYLDG